MKRQAKKMAVTVFIFAGFGLLSGCVFSGSEDVLPVEKTVTCNEVLRHGVSHFSAGIVTQVLQEESRNKDLESCWIPVMQSALKEGVQLPQAELKRAIKQLNTEQYSDAFHEAVYRYLANIARGQESYRFEDKALLRAYCSYLINHAENRNDGRLGQIQLLTKRLDRDMYDRFFE